MSNNAAIMLNGKFLAVLSHVESNGLTVASPAEATDLREGPVRFLCVLLCFVFGYTSKLVGLLYVFCEVARLVLRRLVADIALAGLGAERC